MDLKFKEKLSYKRYARFSSITFILFFLLWCILSYGGLVQHYFLPSPTDVIRDLYILFLHDGFMTDVIDSFMRVFTGFLISAVLAIPIGILMGSFHYFDALLSPFFGYIRFMPASAFIPLLILWLGIGFTEKIAILFISIFFYLVLFVADIARNVKRELIETAVTLGANKRQVLWKVIVPASMPGIWDAMRIMVGVGWTTLVIVEIVGAQTGIAAMMIESQRFLKTGRIIAGIITIGFLGLICDFFFKKTYNIFFKWAED
ncbi:MAG: ABC transporter permease [Deltaproteobacteria bacterium CG07_land_8_20_14_0_80_38_7]|nr:MAG: ABC transporter permease [Deltaproteobacteria bacterium CG07_land_8_20_14_0_80_38_7]